MYFKDLLGSIGKVEYFILVLDFLPSSATWLLMPKKALLWINQSINQYFSSKLILSCNYCLCNTPLHVYVVILLGRKMVRNTFLLLFCFLQVIFCQQLTLRYLLLVNNFFENPRLWQEKKGPDSKDLWVLPMLRCVKQREKGKREKDSKLCIFQATKSVVEKEAIGMTVAMVQGSLAVTPLAMLSRYRGAHLIWLQIKW